MESTIQVLEEVPQVFSTGFPDSSSLWCVQNRHWHFASAPRWAQQQEVAAGAVSSGSCTASIATTQTPAMAKARHQGIANVRWSQPRLRMSRLLLRSPWTVKGPIAHAMPDQTVTPIF